jgi:hypothetical protein
MICPSILETLIRTVIYAKEESVRGSCCAITLRFIKVDMVIL